MPLKVRNSARRRRRKNPDEKLPERPRESTSSSAAAEVMAPTRMKLRVRRRDNVAAAGGGEDQEEEEEEEERSSRRSSSRRKTSSNASSTTSVAAAAPAPSASPPPTSSASARAVMAAEEASPDSKCPICLDRFNNLAYLDRCLHRFCFPCIQEWSHNKAECPLCKQPFASILHSVRAEDDFKEYTLRPPPANSSVAATVAMVAAMASAARSDHQMRLMLRRHRGTDSGETAATTRRRRRERGGGRGRRSGMWEWYLDSPPLTLPPLPHHLAVSPVVAEDSEEGEDVEEQRVRRGADLAERGVIFEGLTGLSGAVAPVAPHDRASRRLMTRLLARQRLQRGGGTVRRLRERETVTFRRALYRSSIRVRGVAGVSGNQGQQQRDITAESFRRNPTHLNRLRPWLRRELTVLYGAHGSLVDIVQRIIMARLARHGLEDTPTVEEELRPFLLARTDHFLHELVSFARSPLSLESYDTQAAYEPPDAALELDGMSSSTDSSSIIAISEGEEEERPAEGRSEERLLARAGGVHDVDVLQSGSCLSLSAWDDETPGPSYSTAEPSCSLASPLFGSAQQEVANEEGGERQGEEEECLIVGYKKPIAERTPELVQLSSDTEEEEDEKKKKEDAAEKLPALPCGATPPPPLSYLPTIPPSTSGAYGHERDDGPKEKDGEADGRRARSWSGSSGRSRKSVCTLSPATPGASECRQERESWTGDGKSGSEKRRRKRRRGRERSGERLRKSGTMYNPNRSIYPAMMCQRSRSPSPLHTSVESGSPLPPSPPDSTWDYHCSQLSPLTSSVSSASRSSSSSPSSSSPLCFSPQLSAAAMPSLLPNHHGEKPGGKRKYKSRHLDSDDKDPTWRPKRREKEGGRRKGKDGGRRRERQRRDVGESNKRSRADRSPSVEIIYEGTVAANATQSPASKRRRKRHRKTQQSSPPVIITLDSDSSHDGGGNKNDSSGSSSPLSSQQTVDFSDLPPLPLVQSSSGMGGAVDAEIGELPVDILDRGSDGSEAEPAGPIAVDNSDHDVENVGESSPLLGSDDDDDDDDDGLMRMRMRKSANQRRGGGDPTTTSLASDSRLLATILNDLKGIAAPKRRPSSPDARKKRCEVGHDSYPNNIVGFDSSPSRAAIRPPPPPGEQPKDHQVREEGKDVPPLLKQASPVRPYNRNTPPPLKHKDAGSPHPSPISPINLHSPHASVGGLGADSHVDFRSNPAIDSRLLPEDDHAIPPISTLKRHYTSALALMGGLTSTSSISEPVDSHSSSSVWENSSTSGDRSSYPESKPFHSKLHSSRDRTKEVASSGLKPAPIDLHPVNSVSPVHFNSAHADSTSRGCREKTLSPNSCLVAPVDLHPSSGCDVFSGVDRNDPSPPVFVSSVDSRTPNISSPADSHSSGKRENLLCCGVSSVPTTAPRLSPLEVHSRSPKSTVDLHSSSAAGLTDSKASSIVNHGKRSPYGCLPPIDLHRTSPLPPANIHPSSRVIDEHSNHTALSAAATFLTSHKNCSSQSDPTVDSHAKLLHRTDSKPRNHFDPRSNPLFPVDAYSEHNLPVGLQPPVDSHLKNSRTDHRITSSPRSVESPWNPDASIDAHPDSHTPETKRDVNV